MAQRNLRTGLYKALAIVVVAAAGVAAALEPALAQSNHCARLQAEYKSASRSSGGGASKSSLKRQLAAAQSQARRKNCRRLFKRASDCRAVNAKVSRLQRQLSQASRGSRSASAGSAQRQRLRNQLRRNGCNVPSGGGLQWAGSGYRTLCVRTCDGFYFPINFRSSRSRFKIDEAVCKSMYGGAGAELFYHNNGSSPDRAVSMNGKKPLSAQPYAFAYRRSFSESCQGELKRGLANLTGVFQTRMADGKSKKGTAKEIAKPSALPTPVARINTAPDPETRANLMAGFVAKRITPEGAEEVVVADIRQLGAEYYYELPEPIAAIYEPPDLGPEFSLFSEARADEQAVVDDAPGATTVQ